MSLRLTFLDLYTQVHNFRSGPGTPTGDDLTAAKDLVYRTYRKFLCPVDMKTKENHIWSWLIKEGTLTLESGKEEYLLPEDFDALSGSFIYTSQNGVCGQISKVSRNKVMLNRSDNNFSGWPVMCYIHPETIDTVVDQKKKVVFWPIPNSAYTINYSYVCIPPKPMNSTDVFIGNYSTDEVLLQMCLAMAEQSSDEELGTQTKLANEQLQSLIMSDSKDSPNTVGHVRDGNISTGVNLRDYILRNSSLNADVD